MPAAENKIRKHYNIIKGRIAESIVQEMFLACGYSVFKYGMEHSVPSILGLLSKVNSDVSKQIRHMPDFIILSKENVPYFIEVKYRTSGEFDFEDLPKNYPYYNSFIVLITPEYIKCLSYEELKTGKKITPTCKNFIGKRAEFSLEKEVVIEFCDFVREFFALQ